MANIRTYSMLGAFGYHISYIHQSWDWNPPDFSSCIPTYEVSFWFQFSTGHFQRGEKNLRMRLVSTWWNHMTSLNMSLSPNPNYYSQHHRIIRSLYPKNPLNPSRNFVGLMLKHALPPGHRIGSGRPSLSERTFVWEPKWLASGSAAEGTKRTVSNFVGTWNYAQLEETRSPRFRGTKALRNTSKLGELTFSKNLKY